MHLALHQTFNKFCFVMNDENVDPSEDLLRIPNMLYSGSFIVTTVAFGIALVGYLVGLDKGQDTLKTLAESGERNQKYWRKYTGRFAALLAAEWVGALALDTIIEKLHDKQMAADLAERRIGTKKGDSQVEEIGLMKRIRNALISGTATLLYAVGLSGLSLCILKDRSVKFSSIKETLRLNQKRGLLTAGAIAGVVEGAFVIGAIADEHKKQHESFAQRLDLERKEAASGQRSK